VAYIYEIRTKRRRQLAALVNVVENKTGYCSNTSLEGKQWDFNMITM